MEITYLKRVVDGFDHRHKNDHTNFFPLNFLKINELNQYFNIILYNGYKCSEKGSLGNNLLGKACVSVF
jgi:hypothetical protein